MGIDVTTQLSQMYTSTQIAAMSASKIANPNIDRNNLATLCGCCAYNSSQKWCIDSRRWKFFVNSFFLLIVFSNKCRIEWLTKGQTQLGINFYVLAADKNRSTDSRILCYQHRGFQFLQSVCYCCCFKHAVRPSSSKSSSWSMRKPRDPPSISSMLNGLTLLTYVGHQISVIEDGAIC